MDRSSPKSQDWYKVKDLFNLFSYLLSLKGRCHGNQLNFRDVCKCRQERHLLVARAFDNGLSDREAAFKLLNGSNLAIGLPRMNFVNFCPILSEFTLFRRVFFAANWPQFDDIFSFVILSL